MSKFKSQQSVYVPKCKQCGIASLLKLRPGLVEVSFNNGDSLWYADHLVRALHETQGYYKPDVGDLIPENGEVLRTDEWGITGLSGSTLRETDINVRQYRFSLPQESLESEKWARKQEAEWAGSKQYDKKTDMPVYKKGQAVYHIGRRACVFITEDVDIHGQYQSQTKNDGVMCLSENLMRTLHSTQGYYVPNLIDNKVDGYQNKLALSTTWYDGQEMDTPLTVGCLNGCEYRFPIPPEALESEKWAREKEAKENDLDFNESSQDHVEKVKALIDMEDSCDPYEVQKPNWINWNPVTDRPKDGEQVYIYDDDKYIRTVRVWNKFNEFEPTDLGWTYSYAVNSPKISPTLEIVRKIQNLSEVNAVKFLDEIEFKKQK